MVLVTGGGGLLGKALINYLLANGEMVRAIYHETAIGISHQNLTEVPADILDTIALEAAMQGIQQVCHCAAIVSFSPADTHHLYKINVEGTANIVNACLAAGVKKMLYVSSVAALGRAEAGMPITEAMQWSPAMANSHYGRSKYLGEMEVWRGIAEGLNAVIVNPVIILGPGDWNKGSAKIFKSAYDEFPWYTEGITGFADVRDVVNAMALLMQSDITAERYIISGGNAAYKDLYVLIAKAFGKKPPHKKATPFLSSVVWRMAAAKSFFTGSKPLLTRETAITAQEKTFYDNSKFLQAFPSFTYYSLEETVQYTAASLQQIINKQ